MDMPLVDMSVERLFEYKGVSPCPNDIDEYWDTALLAKIIMALDYVDENRVGVNGGSQGGALAVACACLVLKIKKCAVCYPYLSDYKRVYEMDMNKSAYEGLRYYF